MEAQNIIRIQGKVIKVEPAHKTGYYLIIEEQETNRQKGVFSQWSYELKTSGLFTLRQDNKYCLIINYQVVLSEPKKEQAENQDKFYQQKQAQEIKRLIQLLSEQKNTNQKLIQRIKLLEKLLKQKETERLTEANQYQNQLKEKAQIIKLNELELEKKISPFNSIERIYYKKPKTPEQEKYL
jgi:hypothetical protein